MGVSKIQRNRYLCDAVPRVKGPSFKPDWTVCTHSRQVFSSPVSSLCGGGDGCKSVAYHAGILGVDARWAHDILPLELGSPGY